MLRASMLKGIAWLVLSGGMAAWAPASFAADPPWWSASVAAALERADTNRMALEQALSAVPAAQRSSWEFLLEHMPEPDLRTLSAEFLAENVALAHQALAMVAWRERLSEELFLNEVLPYACVNERRDPWRKELFERCLPLIEGCTTMGEAARRINEKLFGLLEVRYSTQRRRPDQSPAETIASGMATCTGLSILLVDACRAVAIPARLAGIASWPDGGGNHTWVEVWDEGWHFVGAAEPDPNGLDRAWFAGRASRAVRDTPRNAIYATSYRQTGLTFPLVWARRVDWVSAVNVTDRYTAGARPAKPDQARLLVRVMDRPGGQRVAAPVRLADTTDSAVTQDGTSRGEQADLNDVLTFPIVRGRAYEIRVQHEGGEVRQSLAGTTEEQALVTLWLNTNDTAAAPPTATTAPTTSDAGGRAEPSRLNSEQEQELSAAFNAFFKASPAEQAAWPFPDGLERLLLVDESAVRRLAWQAYTNAAAGSAYRANFEAQTVRYQAHVSPYTVRPVGERPTGGWPLFIAMHGGGNAAASVNDRQWRVMQRYYHDQPDLGGYLYLALRAPNDTWNGFYADYVYPLVANLIRQFVLFGDVNPNKVFLMGYSHGGYGAFAIGPKQPDRFAAIHASAAAPTDGETSPKTLRHTAFSYMIGERDLAYGRLPRCRAFDDAIQRLRGERTDIYPVRMEFIAGNGHTGLPDRDKIRAMYPAVRNPVPRDLTWALTDSVITNFFWLRVVQPGKGQELEAACRDNRIVVTTSTNVTQAAVRLDSRLIDYGRPVLLEVNGQVWEQPVRPSLSRLCQTLEERGDPELAFAIELPLAR